MIAMRTKLPGLSVRTLVCSFDFIGPLFFKILLSVKLIIMTLGVLTSDGELLFTSVNEGDEESEKPLARLGAGDFCLVQVQIVSTGFHSWKLTYEMLHTLN